ncbi:hypothetical protein NKR19_g4531 [Coniochaeta hoffmannii]|uniref:Uncharacterized protein n=1 Tax=Coniochaeta hoffmannii TaxID=91930 RepID=A0AA38VV95_9PEZI|nr:hypothetical protein NKR19_g4531 [Coniochaeta hoffmannii]
MVDAGTYSAVTQGDDDTRTDGASTASPASVSATTTSPSAFLSLSEYALTPLSMVGSDLSYPDGSDDGFFKPDDEHSSSRFHGVSPSRSTAADMGRRNTASQPVSRSPSVRTVSSSGVAACHLSPNPNGRSGSCSGSVAALEATAERFTSTSSIDDAIRRAHEELKRSDSRRSSVLRACSGTAERDNETSALQNLQSQLAALSRQNSIVGINSAARLGGYSPAAYVMSPTNSIKNGSGRFRSVSKASSLGVPSTSGNVDTFDLSEASNAERFPSFLSRHGPGKGSVRSVVSSKQSLVDIAEAEPPMTLTLDALDEADRAEEAGEESEDEDTIRAIAHQHVEEDLDQDPDGDETETPQAEVLKPMLDHDFLNFSAPGALQIHEPGSFDDYGFHEPQEHARPPSAGSGTTYERNAFGDFDGVHCDPDTADFPGPPEPDFPPPPPPSQKRMSRPLSTLPPRPQSYFDMQTGQQMLYYPARVPAMLNLPPKLAKSKKPDRQKVRSQVLSVMPLEARDSRVWLPDPVAERSEPFMSGAVDENVAPAEPSPARASFIADAEPGASQTGSFHGQSAQEANAALSPGKQEREIKRPQRLTDARKSQMPGAVGDLPPQLRASVFFDLPEEPPKIVVKDHSAMATLDSILDASASAPVSAFIDHAFAGTLGSEVYGVEKKKKRKSNADFGIPEQRSQSSLAVLQTQDNKKRGSFLSLLAHTRKSSENLGADRRSTSYGVGDGAPSPSVEGSSRDGNSPNPHQGPFSPSLLDPDSDEEPDKEAEKKEEDEDDESSDEDLDNVYQGRPTTLLAELQIRKQRNKMRTRPVHKVYPNGLHSTLLELDTVAEVERSMRKGKKVNLAWEDPSTNPDLMEEEDDEEVPLAMLAAARAAAAAKGVNKSTLDVGVIMDEVNRPLGLMERRELEENEPLSRRRDRIQGRAPRETLNLETMQKRMTQLSLVHGGAGLKSQSRLALPLHNSSYGTAGSAAASIRSAEPQPEPEVEGETLAQRRKRLQGDTLPTARPVSGTFSVELLEQFGGDEDKATKDKGKEAAAAPVGEQEGETLGQRRRRLQAEREAREREIASKTAGDHRISRRMSMADILTAHPLEPPQGVVNPRELERQRLEAVAAQKQRDHDLRLAAMRSQMPQTLPTASVGAFQGGYMGGQFNDGLAGGLGSGRSLAYGRGPGVPPLQRMSTLPAAYGGNVQQPVYGAAMTMTGVDGPYGMGYPQGFGFGGMPPTQGQLDMVERWRQSIRP